MIVDKEQSYLNIMHEIDLMEGHDFEDFCAILLLNNGFRDVTVTKGSGDYGIDILARYHNKIYGIQCKRYSGPVGIKAIQEALGGYDYYKCDILVVLTNSTFTPQAITQAKVSGVRLWDREYLVNNLIDTCEDIGFIERILRNETDVCEGADLFDVKVISTKDADSILKEKTQNLYLASASRVGSELVANNEKTGDKSSGKQIKVKDYTIANGGIYVANKKRTRNYVNSLRWFCLVSGMVI